MAKGTKPFTALEKNILKAKGLTVGQIGKLAKAGVKGRDDFRTVGDAATLASLVPGLSVETAAAVMAWANGGAADTGTGGGAVVVESAETVYCVHCKAKQPKDWKSGDLCVNCGKEAEPVQVCFWCNQTGPGKVCRRCGTAFVPAEDVELAAQLKREGVAKDEIGPKLAKLSKPDRDALRARAQKYR